MSEIEEHVEIEEQLQEKSEELNFDYEGESNESLLDVLKKMTTDDIKTIELKLKAVQDAFWPAYNEKKNLAFESFKSEGGTKEDFEYKDDEFESGVKGFFNRYAEQIKKTAIERKEQLQSNLKKKSLLLDQLRELVHGEENASTFDEVKKIQEEWKNTGDIPSNKTRDIYPNYKALLDIFYNNRGIYFELKDLDRQKNLKLKTELVEKAEQLISLGSAKKMLAVLQDLHKDYKNIGPIPKENQEPLWERFKEASQKVYDRRDVLQEEFLAQLNKNLEAKKELINKIEEFVSFDSGQIKEWKSKTEEVLKIQEAWKSIGAIPKAESKDVSKEFWSKGKQFFNTKNAFFKSLDKKRQEALAQKETLCEQVEALIDTEDIGQACHEAINLQKEWKKTGPAPRAVSDQIYQRFRTACDQLFNKRRAVQEEADKGLIANLEAKQTLVKSAPEVFENGVLKEVLIAYFEKWNEVGDVPRSDKEQLNKSAQTAISALIKDGEDKDVLEAIVEKELNRTERNAEKIFSKKIAAIRKKLTTIEDDLATGENNLLFFRNSKNFEELKKEFDKKIEDANKLKKSLKEQLKIFRN